MADGDDSASPAETVTSLVLAAKGLPVPAAVRNSAFKALGALIAGVFDVPTAYFEAWAQEIRDEKNARSVVVGAVARAAAASIEIDDEKAKRAASFLGARVLREQTNREAVAARAIAELTAKPVEDSPTRGQEELEIDVEIDSDWLDMFARHAETKSSEEMRTYFRRVLAGEIRSPG
ncbi:MAG: DUF2806 domain-containing protein, partial [Polyangiales bacterium]